METVLQQSPSTGSSCSGSSGFLAAVLAEKRREVKRLKSSGVALPPGDPVARHDFQAALMRPGMVALIGEVKFASPSAGRLKVAGDPASLAEDYAVGGAAALSVLTDQRYFGGELASIPLIKRRVGLPVLRKDFIIDPLQVEETAAWGADAVLLIARILPAGDLSRLLAAAAHQGLAALVEVHDRRDVQKALACGARLIGINNRDLDTCAVDLGRTLELRPLLPPGCTVVSASGIITPDDVVGLAAAGIHAVLVGTALMRAAEPRAAAGALAAAGCGWGR